MKKYWHELSDDEINVLIEQNKTWSFILENYLQPSWCGYNQALNGRMGCWSLTASIYGDDCTRRQISKDFCKTCDLYYEDKKEN